VNQVEGWISVKIKKHARWVRCGCTVWHTGSRQWVSNVCDKPSARQAVAATVAAAGQRRQSSGRAAAAGQQRQRQRQRQQGNGGSGSGSSGGCGSHLDQREERLRRCLSARPLVLSAPRGLLRGRPTCYSQNLSRLAPGFRGSR